MFSYNSTYINIVPARFYNKTIKFYHFLQKENMKHRPKHTDGKFFVGLDPTVGKECYTDGMILCLVFRTYTGAYLLLANMSYLA